MDLLAIEEFFARKDKGLRAETVHPISLLSASLQTVHPISLLSASLQTVHPISLLSASLREKVVRRTIIMGGQDSGFWLTTRWKEGVRRRAYTVSIESLFD